MDGQHQYEINLKKDDLFICLSSDDVYFISKQMDKWFGILLDDSYVPVSLPQRAPAPQPVAESIPVQPMPQQVVPQPIPAEAQFIPAAQVQLPQMQPMPPQIHPPQLPLAQTPAAQPQVQPGLAQPMPTAESNELLAQQLMAQGIPPAAPQGQAMPQQPVPQPVMAAIPQPQPQLQPQLTQAQPTLQDVLEQVGQPNLPSFVPQQAPVQPSVLNAMPAQAGVPAYQDVNLPMAQAPMMQQPVPQQPLPQPMAQPQPQLQAAPPVAEPVIQPVPQTQPQAQPVPQAMPQPVPQPVAVGAPALVQPEDQDDFEAVMNSLLRDFEDRPPETPGFAAAKGAARERIEPDLSGITSLADLCDRSNAANSEDYLLLSAYYLTRLERQETFSLKKVNSVLVKSGLTPVNHSVLETVLSNGYLSMLPDLTGMAEVTEYQISNEGIEAAIALL